MADSSAAELPALEENYKSLMLEATLLKYEMEAICELISAPLEDQSILSKLTAISEGRVSTAVATDLPLSVRELVRTIPQDPDNAQSVITSDFEAFVLWLSRKASPPSLDDIRKRLLARRELLQASLPRSLSHCLALAFAHTERSFLQKRYANDETMLGDKVGDIPRENLFVSEDNYAWDMDELAQAITANDGVMRNPLSKHMFSEADIQIIVKHPKGQRLMALQVAQSELRKGLRHATIIKVANLGKTMLEDQSDDAAPARKAVDEFHAYVATLPEQEQRTLGSLKIPARDRHTGQPYDYTIGDAINDAKANTTCFHKAGDFLSQASEYLRRV